MIEVYNSVGGVAFFERLLREWKNSGAEVTPFHALSEAEYRTPRGRLARAAMRWRMYAGFGWSCWRNARAGRNRRPLRVVTTNPFFLPSLVARATRGHGATIQLLYDLFPDALIQAGKISAGSRAARRCEAMVRFALRECEATVFLGERLRAYAESAYGPARRARVISVGADGTPFADSPPRKLGEGVRPRILYSGLMGRMHDTATFSAVLDDREANSKNIAWAFHASGVAYQQLRRAGDVSENITWGDPLPDAQWRETMTQSHVTLVTVAAGAERIVMPSKIYSALVAGQAVLAICPRNSDLSDLVSRHDCGWVVEPGDVGGLRQVLARVASRPDELELKRRNAFAAGHGHYDMRHVAELWMKLFEELRSSEVCASVSAPTLRPA